MSQFNKPQPGCLLPKINDPTASILHATTFFVSVQGPSRQQLSTP